MPGAHPLSALTDRGGVSRPCFFPVGFTTLQHATLDRIVFLIFSAATGDRGILKTFLETPRLSQSLSNGQIASLCFLLIFANIPMPSKQLPHQTFLDTVFLILITTEQQPLQRTISQLLPPPHASQGQTDILAVVIADQRWWPDGLTAGRGDPRLSLEVCSLGVLSVENRN